jgi:hypothetical protein
MYYWKISEYIFDLQFVTKVPLWTSLWKKQILELGTFECLKYFLKENETVSYRAVFPFLTSCNFLSDQLSNMNIYDKTNIILKFHLG